MLQLCVQRNPRTNSDPKALSAKKVTSNPAKRTLEMKHFGVAVSTGTTDIVPGEETADLLTSAQIVRPLMSIRVPIVPILLPQDSVLGTSCPLPHSVSNQFVNIWRFKELLLGSVSGI